MSVLRFSAGAFAATLTVRQDGTGTYSTIGGALQAANDGDTILIGVGTYHESLVVSKSVAFESESGASLTILDGQDQSRLFVVQGAYTVSFRNLTFKRAMADDGSALLVWQQADVSLSGCIIADNHATGSNAVHVRHPGTSLSIDNCQFLRNVAVVHSGALSASMGAALYVSNSQFIENSASGHGAMNVQSAYVEVTGCLFLRNSGGPVGALTLEMSSGFVTGNTFHANSGSSGTVRLYDYTLFSQNIVTGDVDGYGLETVSGTFHTCNLYYDNELGACSRPLGNGERVEDPLYCESVSDVFLVCSGSAALAANNGCGAMGAYGMGCERVPVSSETTHGVS
ncbi:MAG: hypothetical protein IPG61_15030 [bacterium]|nr:hypothetical protein [bacterium]